MFPAQALAEAMLARGWRVALATDARGLRYAGGFPRDVERRQLSAASFARGGMLTRLLVPLNLARGVWQAWRWFRRARPAAVAGFGGYPAFPALAAAALTGTPRLIHEQNGVLGRVNRLFAARVDVVACGTWPLVNAPEGVRLKRVGNPVRPAIEPAPYTPPGETVNLLVFGGSQGASAFARVVPPALAALDPALRSRLRVVQQAREGETAGVEATLAEAGIAAEVAPFFTDMPARLAAAHLVIARAGASTVAELAAVGRPAILVPYPAAMDDHQSANARALAERGAALVLREMDLTAEELAGHLTRLLADGTELARMAEAAQSASAPGAATMLADTVNEITKL